MIRYETASIERLDTIKSLWEKLNLLHLGDSVYFKDHFENFTFEKRLKAFKNILPENINLDIVYEEDNPVGYCLSTMKENIGEIDSLFLESSHRGRGIGETLAGRALSWLKGKKPARLLVAVSYGHDEVIPFYQKMGFYPRYTALEFKSE